MSLTQQLEQQLVEVQKTAEYGKMVTKLLENREFRKVILEGFCGREAARYVQESADPALTADQRADALAMAQASGHLKRFLDISQRLAEQAKDSVVAIQQAIVESRQEENE